MQAYRHGNELTTTTALSLAHCALPRSHVPCLAHAHTHHMAEMDARTRCRSKNSCVVAASASSEKRCRAPRQPLSAPLHANRAPPCTLLSTTASKTLTTHIKPIIYAQRLSAPTTFHIASRNAPLASSQSRNPQFARRRIQAQRTLRAALNELLNPAALFIILTGALTASWLRRAFTPRCTSRGVRVRGVANACRLGG